MSYMSDWLSTAYRPDSRPDEWLYSNREGTTILERMAFLIYAKGPKRHITWGAWAAGEGPWGRGGLSQAEALELIYLYGVRDGIAFIEGTGSIEEFHKMVAEETKRVAEEQGYIGDADELE